MNFGGSWMIGLGWTLGVTGALGAGGGGGGGGGGGAAGSTKNALTAEVGSGSSSEVSRGTTMTNSSTIAWMASETGSVYDCLVLWATTSDSMRSSKSLCCMADASLSRIPMR